MQGSKTDIVIETINYTVRFENFAVFSRIEVTGSIFFVRTKGGSRKWRNDHYFKY